MKGIWASFLFFLLFIKLEELSACNDCIKHEVRSDIAIQEHHYDRYGDYQSSSKTYPILYRYLKCTCKNSPSNTFSLDRMSVEASIVIFSNSTVPVIPLGAFSLNKHFEKIFLNSSQVKEIELGAFNGLTKLKELHLENNELRDIKEGTFTTLTNLEILNISNNKIEILEDKWFLGLSNLKELYLSQNMIKSISANAFYGLLQGMRILDLSHNQLKELHNSLLDNILTKFVVLNNTQSKRLTKLDISYNEINHSVEFLHFSHLNELNLNNNNIDGLVNLNYIQNLEVLNLCCNNLTNISNVPSTLKYFSVKSNKIHNIDCVIEHLVNLTTLDLSNINLKKLDHALFKNLPALNNLYLQNNELSDILIGSFQTLGELMVLNLSSNVLREFDYGSFTGLTNLEVLDVSNNSLYNLHESTLYSLKNLRNLNIASNNLIVLDTQELLNFNKRLHSISLNGNQWDCKSLVKTCQVLLNSNVTILDGFSPKNVRHVHGITCSINDNLDVAFTVNPNSENEKIDMKEFNALKNFLQFEFHNTSFYKYFQNYITEINQNRLPNNNNSNYFNNLNKSFENSKFYKFFNQTEFLNKFNASIANITKTIESSETKMLNLSLNNVKQFYESTRNFSNFFNQNFKNTNFYKYFNYDFANTNFFKYFNQTKQNLTNLYLLEDTKNLKIRQSNESIPNIVGVGNDNLKHSFEKLIDNNSETNRNVLQQNTFIILTTFIIVLLILNLIINIYKKLPKLLPIRRNSEINIIAQDGSFPL